MTDQIPPSLVRFGADYERAVRRELSHARTSPRPRRGRFRVAAVSTTALAVIAAAVVFVIGAATGTPPAYALTQNADGSITITLSNLSAGIPALNARLTQLGINETVIPVTQNCPFTTPVLSGPGPGADLSQTITIGPGSDEPTGVRGYLAAEQLPDGSIGLGIGGMKGPLPSCFSPALMKVQPSNTPNPHSAGKAHH